MSWALFHHHATRARALWLVTASGFALMACPVAAQQTVEPPVVPAPATAPDLQDRDVPADTNTAPTPATDQQVGFAADNLNYDSDTEVVVAEGNVEMNREAIEMRADKVTWNRKTGEVVAEGGVAIKNPEGDTAYGDRVVLTDSLRDGVIDNMLVVLDNGARLAAVKGTRFDNGNIELENAAYTPCPVEDDSGCPKNPSWQIRAVRVIYDRQKNKVKYKGARVEIFGLPLIPLPGLSHPANREAGSGLLVPEIRLDRTNGFEIAVPYYIRLASDRDITITPHIYTSAAPMLEGEFRALTDIGSFRINGYATHSSVVPVSGQVIDPNRQFRGYLESAGKFQFSPRWSLTYSGRITTDRTFMRRYDISRDDRLRSTFELERIGGPSYLSIAGWATPKPPGNEVPGQEPAALPVHRFSQGFPEPPLRGQVGAQPHHLR
ncbi:MAG: LPS-assembly protein LptD, partial [Sphingopyxis sp.]|nr:LPS-assembly protein LptD [Sphingopyxis sp.]